MTWLLFFGLITGVLAKWILAWLPPPPEVIAEIYRQLATLRFLTVNAMAIFLAATIVAGCFTENYHQAWAPVASIGVFAALIDNQTRLLPTPLLTVAAIGLGFGTPTFTAAVWGVVGALLWASVYLFIWRIGPGLGFGDIRLAGILGYATGMISLSVTISSMALAGLTASVWGLYRRREFAFGPHLVSSALICGAVFSVTDLSIP